MPMPPYSLRCYQKGCERLAVYKIAARWSDGITSELKTYGLCCAECLAQWYQLSRQKQAACRTTPGETLEPPGIYRIERGQRDKKLERLTDLEKELGGGPK
jgi:hypothetical protein